MSTANQPAKPGGNTPSGPQTVAAFVVAVVLLVALLGSALTGLVPAQYAGRIFQLGIAAAGGGFALFLIGIFHWKLPNGMRIGGPLGVFVLLLLLNPGKEIPEYISEYLNKNFQACRDNVQSQQYDVAEADCAKAAYELPDSGAAMHWLALSQYYQGRYSDAIATWKRALRLGYDPARTNYNIAFANFQLGRFDQATEAARAALEKSATNPGLKARVWFLTADAELSLWNFGKGPEQHFAKAREAFQAFMEIGSPKYKAEAELACILAVKAELTAAPAEKDQYEDEAINTFTAALGSIKTQKTQSAETERSLFVTSYEPTANRCGAALSELWKKKRPAENYDSLLIKVRD